ncbi:MAG TPA: hypothetical protein DCL15_11600 [Chloroflexi bacterium]|nr:hypothetical protein [Chloroflexota bacterium]
MPVKDFDPTTDGYGSKYVKGADFEEPEYLTITDVNLTDFQDGTRKLVLTFNDGREATVNKRNYTRLTEKFGADPNAWIGKTVLCMAGDAYQGRPSLVMVPQVPKTAAKRTAPAMTAPATEDDAEDVVFA